MSKKIYSEKLVARYLLNVIKEADGLIFKMHPITNKGIPDYLVHCNGHTFYVETKTTGKVCTEAQVFFHKMLKEQGIETYVLDVPVHTLKELQTLSYKTY